MNYMNYHIFTTFLPQNIKKILTIYDYWEIYRNNFKIIPIKYVVNMFSDIICNNLYVNIW